MATKTRTVNMAGLDLVINRIVTGKSKHPEGNISVDTDEGSVSIEGDLTVGGSVVRTARQAVLPICGNAKVGATAGWVVTGGTKICHATLPASQTNSTLVVPIDCLHIGDTITAVGVTGQVESAGNAVTLTMSVRKLTTAAGDNVDAELGTDNVGSLTADTALSSANLGVSGLSEVIAEGETVYVLLTGTTLASTDIDLTGLVVTYTSA